ncbi:MULTISPECIES: peptidase U32 family protein [Flavobacterium]|uniref:U32 family peptidase n=2 Tax=Flavobacterium TaxID=237 RepID=A0AA94F672_9FLAO|nr:MULTISPECIES: U32 family peptidase [Flavobacterium]OXA75779.1 peptidase U32 [Flavobacterium columnare] [Flavobacterium columnare NBRC 100251 = ATCC 23463]AMA50594.1 peptidase U32 [Flavobacterium covae]MCH4830231.1 U32 family peptidase [Flavobacterium columnare]MCH4832386.1 U32 family peptidase [Flavobacterium columnare]MCJ1806651.1 U32 family peptidase [Flavobacterium covae]
MKRKIEILAPAKDLTTGIAAINAGADAVYVGAPQFGARSNANNSIEDVAALVQYAHLYNVQVFVVINTIIYDGELETCRQLIWKLYEIGVDALIVQDMGVLELDLPPIPLHASTQANNRDPKKIKFLADAGIQRVVLARELNLHQIKEISEATDVELEFFVTGALCVSFSGNCYMSVANGERSANRGSCAQNCRLPYNLIDGHGETLIRNSHLLSIKDFDVTNQIPNLVEAGICSFKIEGRLKDVVYVKNNVSFLRKKLDTFLAENNEKYTKASSGSCTYTFDSELTRTFNRGYTDYFVNERHQSIGSWDSPKSKGQYIGKLIKTVGNSYIIENGELLNNGDGLCYINEDKIAEGIYVNKAENGIIYPNVLKEIPPGTEIYRNNDAAFIKLVEREDSAIRKISTSLLLKENENGFELIATDEDGNISTVQLVHPKEKTKNGESIEENFKINLAKTGFTPYTADEITIEFSENWFLPISKINEMRRNVYEQLSTIRLENYNRKEFQLEKTSHPYPETKLDFTYNVANKTARKFYERHGVTEIEKAFELQWDPGKSRVMTTKYCIKYELERCPKYHRENMDQKLKEPLVLKQGELEYKLKFNCKPCEMEIWEKDAEFEIEEDHFH